MPRCHFAAGALVTALALAVPLVPVAAAADGTGPPDAPLETTLTLTGPVDAPVGARVDLAGSLAAGGAPLSGPVTLSRGLGDAVTTVRTRPTDGAGSATLSVRVSGTQPQNTFTLTYAGDETHAPATSGPVVVTAYVVHKVALDLAVTTPVEVDRSIRFKGSVRYADGEPGGPTREPVTVQRREDGSWVDVTTAFTGSGARGGRFAGLLPERASRQAGRYPYRAVVGAARDHAAGRSARTGLVVTRRATTLGLVGPARLRYGTPGTVRASWRDDRGAALSGGRVTLQRRDGRAWEDVGTTRTKRDGTARLQVIVTRNSVYRAVVAETRVHRAAAASRLRITVLPPGRVVVLPGAAPRPRITLPAQPRAKVGAGARARTTAIPDAVWNQMVGRTWHSGCPVGRSGLRLVRVSYWGYDGWPHRGELVVAASAAAQFAGAFTDLYDAGLPIRSMYREDRFGWSERLHGADDYASMSAGNTSAFNCRGVVGNPSVASPHSHGRALDINTWENVYFSARGVEPNRYWGSHALAPVTNRSGDDVTVRVLRAHGFAWTYGTGDAQHFDARPSGRRGGLVPWSAPRAGSTSTVLD